MAQNKRRSLKRLATKHNAQGWAFFYYRHNMKINFLGLLTILFIGLKLTHYIDWSWWLVLLPLYIWPLIMIAGSLIAFIVACVIVIIDEIERKCKE